MTKIGIFAMAVMALSLITVIMASGGNDMGGVMWSKINPNGTGTINYYNESHMPGYILRVYPNGTVIREPLNGSNIPHNISNVTTHYVENWDTTPTSGATSTPSIVSTPSASAQHGSHQIPGFDVGLVVGMLLVSCLMRRNSINK